MEVLLGCLILRQTLLWRCKTGQRLRSLKKPVDTGKASWPLIYADFLRCEAKGQEFLESIHFGCVDLHKSAA